jgi:hypothetical protein
VFWVWSLDQIANSEGNGGLLRKPPIYGGWEPTWTNAAVVALAAVVVVAAAAHWLVTARLPAAVFLALTTLTGTAVSFAVNAVRGEPSAMLQVLCRTTACGDYGRDAVVLRSAGVYDFVHRFPTVYRTGMVSVENRTHPPGALVVWDLITQAFGRGYAAATAMAIVSIGGLSGAAWLMGRVAFGEPAGRRAALLVALAPAPLWFAFTTMDGVYATFLAGGGALLVVAAYTRREWIALCGGEALGLTSFMTYAAVLVAFACVPAVVFTMRKVVPALRTLAAATAGGLLALAMLRVGVGYDLFACNATVSRIRLQPRPMRYWVFGTPVVFLIAVGAASGGLAIVGMFTRHPPMTIVLLLGMLVFADLPRRITGLYPGEIERTWLFVQPFIAVAAGAALADWEAASRFARRVGAALVVASGGAIAVVVQLFYDTKR